MIDNSEYTLSEQPAINLFQRLGYQYQSVGKERENLREVVLKERLLKTVAQINPWLSENNLKLAIREITSFSGDLLQTNKEVYKLIEGRKFSVEQIVDNKKQYKGIAFIDFENIENNNFLVTNQMPFGGEVTSIPDIVVYVNGLPLAVIECKSPKKRNAIKEAISDLNYYQINNKKLFYYNQICVGIYRVGGKYAAIEAKPIHYQYYKSEDNSVLQKLLSREILPQDILLYNLFEKRRFLDIIRNFVIFETKEGKTVKKLPRYQQLRATNKTIAKLQTKDKGGVIWHTQGSGKSITMVYLAKKLQREESDFNNPTIVVMTDRVDLDNQISGTFHNCDLDNVNRAQSVKHLRSILKNDYGGIVTTTLQKFRESNDDGKILDEKDLDKIGALSEKENIYVLIDEAHRSQYGFLAAFMRKSLPNAKFVAFTGTPIDKEEKSTLAEFYGGSYLDVYTIKQSEEDGSTLPILYEAGLPDLYVEKELLNKEFRTTFQDESESKREVLKKKASSMEKFINAKERIQQTARHMIEHYQTKVYPEEHKAMLVCFNRAAAILYKKTLDELRKQGVHDFNSRIVMSFSPKKDPQEYYDLATPEEERKTAIENFKLPFGNEQQLEKSGRLKHNNDAILIVSDMLLTGYDAPIIQAMYLDKPLKEHNLLQAIARVNRTRPGKECGLVIDYCGITENLIEALAIFSGDLEPQEVMKNYQEEFPRLETRHSQLVSFFKSIKADRRKDRTAYVDQAVLYIEPENYRDQFKELLGKFNQSISIVLPNPLALKFEYDFQLYNEIKLQASNIYIEDQGLRITSEENKKLQKLIDKHLKANGISNLLSEPISIMDRERLTEEFENSTSDKSRELKMRNRLKYMIKVGLDKNPDFYKPLAQRLEELIQKLKNERISQLELFEEYNKMLDAIENKQQEAQQLGFNNEREFAVYKTLEAVVENPKQIVIDIFQKIAEECSIVGWEEKKQIQKEMRRKIKSILRGKVSSEEMQKLPHVLVDIIRKN